MIFHRMIFHRLASGLIAGAIAGLLAALLHFSFVQEYILLSESYETGTVTHFPDGHVGHDAPQTQSDNSPRQIQDQSTDK